MAVKCVVYLRVSCGSGSEQAAFVGVVGRAVSASLEMTLQQLQRWGCAHVGVIRGSGAEDCEGTVISWVVTVREPVLLETEVGQ
jgi:hypothetical protein